MDNYSPSEEEWKAADPGRTEISFTRMKMREDGFFRKILPPLPLANDELDRSYPTDLPKDLVDRVPPPSQAEIDEWRRNNGQNPEDYLPYATAKPFGSGDFAVKVIDKEPDSPAVVRIPFAQLPDNLHIKGRTYYVHLGDGPPPTNEMIQQWERERMADEEKYGKPDWARYYGENNENFEFCPNRTKRGSIRFTAFVGKKLEECDRLWEDLTFRLKPKTLQVIRWRDGETGNQFRSLPGVDVRLNEDGTIRAIDLEL